MSGLEPQAESAQQMSIVVIGHDGVRIASGLLDVDAFALLV